MKWLKLKLKRGIENILSVTDPRNTIRDEDLVISKDSDSHHWKYDGLTLNITKVNGGHVVTVRDNSMLSTPQTRSKKSEYSTYIISDDKSVSEEIVNILTIELLKQ